MAHVLIRHKVNNYDAWKSAFDEFIDTRRAGGEKSWQIFRLEEDPNNLVLLFEWGSFDTARAFLDSSDLKSTMEKAGVAEAPDIKFLNEAAAGTV